MIWLPNCLIMILLNFFCAHEITYNYCLWSLEDLKWGTTYQKLLFGSEICICMYTSFITSDLIIFYRFFMHNSLNILIPLLCLHKILQTYENKQKCTSKVKIYFRGCYVPLTSMQPNLKASEKPWKNIYSTWDTGQEAGAHFTFSAGNNFMSKVVCRFPLQLQDQLTFY